MDFECESVPSLDEYTAKMNKLRDDFFLEAKGNIKAAQQRMKKDYDRKNRRVKVLINFALLTHL